jgi:DNA-binding LacI/PurR family transcriptional regulator
LPITLRDVARYCGLSPSTVSGVLNERPGTWASAETRRRVFEAAESLGYRPHSAARALRTGRTQVVAFLLHLGSPRLQTDFDGSAEILARHLGERGYALHLHVYPGQTQVMEGLEELMRRQSCDAVVLFGRESDVAEQGLFLERHGIPFVVKGRHERAFPHWPQADYDHEGMMRRAVEHLAQGGRRRIAFLGYREGEVYQAHLHAGFCAAVRDVLRAEPEERFMALFGSRAEAIEATEPLLEGWLSLPEGEQPTGIVIGTGATEWHAIERALARRGRVIGDGPGQLAVVGQGAACSGSGVSLAFGHGRCFSDVGYASIAEGVAADLLPPLLAGQAPSPPIRRILPYLIPTGSLGLPPPTGARRTHGDRTSRNKGEQPKPL